MPPQTITLMRDPMAPEDAISEEEAEQAITEGKLDAVAFGTSFLANPDLPERIKAGVALNTPDASTFYTPGAKGYTDYPVVMASVEKNTAESVGAGA